MIVWLPLATRRKCRSWELCTATWRLLWKQECISLLLFKPLFILRGAIPILERCGQWENGIWRMWQRGLMWYFGDIMWVASRVFCRAKGDGVAEGSQKLTQERGEARPYAGAQKTQRRPERHHRRDDSVWGRSHSSCGDQLWLRETPKS